MANGQSEFVLVDQDGTPRIILSADRRVSSISIVGDDGRAIILEVFADRCSVQILRGAGRMGCLLTSSAESTSVLIGDAAGRPRIILHADLPELKGELLFHDEHARVERRVAFP
jgi:hypothetical protein